MENNSFVCIYMHVYLLQLKNTQNNTVAELFYSTTKVTVASFKL